MTTLKIIMGSTRQGRMGMPVARWFHEAAVRHGKFEIEMIDLAEVNLPMFDEPRHPRLRTYEHEHTKAWSARIDPADAFVFVTPEYNFGPPAALKNAIDYLFQEWNYKPAAFVSYGGISGGTRCIQILRQILGALRMVDMVESVPIAFFAKQVDSSGIFRATEAQEKLASDMLDELFRWAEALKPMRRR